MATASLSASLTHERLLAHLFYDPLTGLFQIRNKSRRWSAGKIVGHMAGDGYIYVKIDKRMHLAHRLAWFYIHGAWPMNDVDHVNRTRTDNRLENLREATRSQNNVNSSLTRKTATGYKGVTRSQTPGKYLSR